jgi:putative PIN family toxin of toxin-antitoxin system
VTPPAAPARIVLDTNVLLDLWVFDDPGTRWLAAALSRRPGAALRSTATEREFVEVLARPRFEVSPEQQRDIVRRWQALSALVATIAPAPLVCSDPDDQKFLDLAHAARARLLLTKDRALLRLRRRAPPFGLAIARPDAAASVLFDQLFDQDVA